MALIPHCEACMGLIARCCGRWVETASNSTCPVCRESIREEDGSDDTAQPLPSAPRHQYGELATRRHACVTSLSSATRAPACVRSAHAAAHRKSTQMNPSLSSATLQRVWTDPSACVEFTDPYNDMFVPEAQFRLARLHARYPYYVDSGM